MAIQLEGKKAIVAEVNEAASGALSVVLADYRGVNSGDMTALRTKAREQNVYLRVVRNTLAKRAVQGTDFECVSEALAGPTLFAFSMEDPGAGARLLKDFSKENDNFEIKALAVGGELLGGEQIDRLAKLPTRDEALGQLASVMQAPITKLARTFNEVPSKATRAVAAVRDQKKEAA
ncbi:50S ribosomal protein L10 [Salicola sp. Rm-C-2C1-2]|uniref:50S ribosomal protein L10 n=1 Tax=Salicola sp. Rm-C-2C1-2 TaxID=3141321 RepID=UPI0032E3DAD5